MWYWSGGIFLFFFVFSPKIAVLECNINFSAPARAAVSIKLTTFAKLAFSPSPILVFTEIVV